MSRNATIQIALSVLLGGISPAFTAEIMPVHGTNSSTHVTMVQSENLLTAFNPDLPGVAQRIVQCRI